MPPTPSWRHALTAIGAILATVLTTPAIAYAQSATTADSAAGARRAAAMTARTSAGTSGVHTVTLITGDRVRVSTLADGKAVVTVTRPRELTGVVETQSVGKDLFVYPTEALPYVAAGVLDQRLFDVTKLIADGYDDASTRLPLIVQFGGESASRTIASMTGLSVRQLLPSIGGAAESATLAEASKLWQQLTPTGSLTRAVALSAKLAILTTQARSHAISAAHVLGGGISRIWLDDKAATANLADSTAQVGAPAAVKAGLNGTSPLYNLTVKSFDRKGKPLPGVAAIYQTGTPYPSQIQIPASGVLTMRLPKGEYSIVMLADLPAAAGPDDLGLGLLSAPDVVLDRNREADLDARKAHEVMAITPQRTQERMLRVEWNRVTGGFSFNLNYLVPVFYTSLWAQRTATVTHGSFNFVTRWDLAAPQLTLRATHAHLPAKSLVPHWQAGAPMLPAGTSRLRVVYAGYGLRGDYAGVDAQGKAVVVRYDRQANLASQLVVDAEQAATAARAGAKLLLVVNDSVGVLSAWYGTADGSSNGPIPVASLRHVAGSSLIAATLRHGLKLKVMSTPDSPYVYDLVERHDGAIPADLTYAPTHAQLARVNSRFAGPASAEGDAGRYDMENFDTYSLGFDFVQALHTSRTDWVTPGVGKIRWYDEADIVGVVQERSLVHTLAAGSRSSENWFSPIIRPRLNTSSTLPTRAGNFFTLNTPGWADANFGDAGFDDGLFSGKPDPLHETVTLYQGSMVLQSTPYQQVTVNAPSAKRLPYRLVAEENQSGVFATSSASRTEWDFTSGATSNVDVLPLIQLDYGIATDLAGNAARRSTFTIEASYLPGAVGTGKIDKPGFEVSYNDGSSWMALPVRPTADGKWTADIEAPKWAAYVSIRSTVTDSVGNRFSQTVLRAFGLK